MICIVNCLWNSDKSMGSIEMLLGLWDNEQNISGAVLSWFDLFCLGWFQHIVECYVLNQCFFAVKQLVHIQVINEERRPVQVASTIDQSS